MLVTLGPVTNVALAVAKTPHIVKSVSRCMVRVILAMLSEKFTPASEYTVWCDLGTARICFRSGLPIEMVGWELCRGEANFTEAEIQAYKKDIGTILSKFTIDCNAFSLTTNQM